MSIHSGMFVMVSVFILFRSATSYYPDSVAENDENDFDELRNELIGEWRTSGDDSYSPYSDNMKRLLLRNNPNFFYVPSMQNKRQDKNYFSNAKLAKMDKMMYTGKKNLLNNSNKDEPFKPPGKPTLSIISPLDALSRKVAVHYITRQREHNRGLLNNYGKRSSSPENYMDSFSEQNEPTVLESDSDKLKQVSCCPPYERRLYGFYQIP